MIIVDESPSGNTLHSFSVVTLEESLSVREIIRARIWQEVHDHNSERQSSAFTGLVTPKSTPLDWEAQFEMAQRSFESNGFFIIIGDRQAASLDEVFSTNAETEVKFIKLIALIGG